MATTCDGDLKTGSQKQIWIYIDNSNIWRGAKQLAATKAGWMKTELEEDPRIRISMGKLIDVITRSRPVAGGVVFWTKYPPPVESSPFNWEVKEQTTTDVNADIARKAYLTPLEKRSTIVVVSGDSRFFPGIKKALEMGWNIEIYSWSRALATCLKDLPHVHVADTVTVSYLEAYPGITFKSMEFNPTSATVSPNTKAAVLRMKMDTLPLSAEFFDKLENVSQCPFQYYRKNSKTSDLVLIFLNAERFDVDVFLEQVIERPPAGVECVKYYNAPQCPYGFCCKYGVKCFKEHTSNEMEFFRKNEGVGKPLWKVSACQYYDGGCCQKSKNECNYAHGKEDAVCSNCSQNGHFKEDCQELQRCQGKFCCRYGLVCKKNHTVEEIEFFKSNRGVGKPYKKVKSCQFFEKGACNKYKEDCDFAHGEEDALCLICGKNGHFEASCSNFRQIGKRM